MLNHHHFLFVMLLFGAKIFAMQYANVAEVLEPQELRDELRIAGLSKKYAEIKKNIVKKDANFVINIIKKRAMYVDKSPPIQYNTCYRGVQYVKEKDL